MAEKSNKWLFTTEEIENTPSRLCNLKKEEEINLRYKAGILIHDIGQQLKVDQLCINTAVVYMHRFYMKQSFTKFNIKTMAPACIFLAAKVEEQPRKIEYIAKLTYKFLNPTVPDPKSPEIRNQEVMELAEEICIDEQILLQTLGFETIVEHPHTQIVTTCGMIQASKELSHSSYIFASSSLLVTSMCIEQPASIIACVCIDVACHWGGFEIPASRDDKAWYTYVEPSLTPELLEALSKQLSASIDKFPNKIIKKKPFHHKSHVEETDILQKRQSETKVWPASIAPTPLHTSPIKLQTEHQKKTDKQTGPQFKSPIVPSISMNKPSPVKPPQISDNKNSNIKNIIQTVANSSVLNDERTIEEISSKSSDLEDFIDFKKSPEFESGLIKKSKTEPSLHHTLTPQEYKARRERLEKENQERLKKLCEADSKSHQKLHNTLNCNNPISLNHESLGKMYNNTVTSSHLELHGVNINNSEPYDKKLVTSLALNHSQTKIMTSKNVYGSRDSETKILSKSPFTSSDLSHKSINAIESIKVKASQVIDNRGKSLSDKISLDKSMSIDRLSDKITIDKSLDRAYLEKSSKTSDKSKKLDVPLRVEPIKLSTKSLSTSSLKMPKDPIKISEPISAPEEELEEGELPDIDVVLLPEHSEGPNLPLPQHLLIRDGKSERDVLSSQFQKDERRRHHSKHKNHHESRESKHSRHRHHNKEHSENRRDIPSSKIDPSNGGLKIKLKIKPPNSPPPPPPPPPESNSKSRLDDEPALRLKLKLKRVDRGESWMGNAAALADEDSKVICVLNKDKEGHYTAFGGKTDEVSGRGHKRRPSESLKRPYKAEKYARMEGSDDDEQVCAKRNKELMFKNSSGDQFSNEQTFSKINAKIHGFPDTNELGYTKIPNDYSKINGHALNIPHSDSWSGYNRRSSHGKIYSNPPLPTNDIHEPPPPPPPQ